MWEGVRVSDARVFAGAGNPRTLLRVERARCGLRAVELRIELPVEPGAITVACSGGAGPEQRMVTAPSQLSYADATSPGGAAPRMLAMASSRVTIAWLTEIPGARGQDVSPPPARRASG